MTTQVNSPFLVKKIRPRQELQDALGDDLGPVFNNYLDQLERVLEQLYRRTGGSTDSVSAIESEQNLFSLLAELKQQVGSGEALTIDDTGITIDSTKLSIDRIEY